MRLKLTFSMFFIFMLLVACTNNSNNQIQEINELEEKVKELNQLIDEQEIVNGDLRVILSEKEKELIQLESYKDFDKSLSNSNINGHFGPFHQSVWGESGHLYSGYIKTIFQRIFFKEDYYWLDGGKLDVNPIENFLGREEYQNNLLGLKFNNAFNSTLTSLPENIIEVWLLSLDDESNRLYLVDINQIWYAYEVHDSNLKADFRVFRSILESYDEWIKDSIN